MKNFSLQEHEFIILCDLLKTMNLCDSGGQAKMVISEGKVKVDGEVELRKRCKIREGSIVEFSVFSTFSLKILDGFRLSAHEAN